MAITHTFAGGFQKGGYGYYAFIEDNELVIGENWPHEGGEIYRGTFANASRVLKTLEKEATRLYNSITKYYTKNPDETDKTILANLNFGNKFKREDDEKEYMLIDMDVSKCFVFGDKLQGFVAALCLDDYKVMIFAKETKVKCTTPIKESTATEDFFSADEVRKMSQEEVRKNYDKILKSMSYWK